MELNKNQSRIFLGGKTQEGIIHWGYCDQDWSICHHRQGNVCYPNLYSLRSYTKEEFLAHSISCDANLLANNIFVQQKNSFILV